MVASCGASIPEPLQIADTIAVLPAERHLARGHLRARVGGHDRLGGEVRVIAELLDERRAAR